ncbi:MAG: hypothetical protein IT349_06090, partial [Candidatus Eisenbacteria bacterium]|nr:hypothetical protein [Candidatus Eisenbacteria bacterium]
MRSAGGSHVTAWPSATEGLSVPLVIVTNDTDELGRLTGISSECEVYAGYLDHGSGLTVAVRTVDAIQGQYAGFDRPASIQGFLRDAVVNWGTTYVILAGDEAIVPARRLGSPSSGVGSRPDPPSDYWFTRVDPGWQETWNQIRDQWIGGSDADIDAIASHGFSDLFIGRLPVRTTEEAQAVFNKLAAYRYGWLGQPGAGYWRSALFAAGPTNDDAWNGANGIRDADLIAEDFEPLLSTGHWTAAHKLYPDVLNLVWNGCECYGALGDKISTSFARSSGTYWTSANGGTQLRDFLSIGEQQVVYHVEHSFRTQLGAPSAGAGLSPAEDDCAGWSSADTDSCRKKLLVPRFSGIKPLNISEVHSLSNGVEGGAFFFLYSSGSYSNMHDMQSISEELIRAPNGGAIGYVGKTNSWPSTYRNVFDRILSKTWVEPASAASSGGTGLPIGVGWALGIDESHGSGLERSEAVVATVLPVLGDPSLAPFLGAPGDLVVTTSPATLPKLGAQTISVTVRRQSDNGLVPDAVVCVRQSDRTYARSLTSASGVATFRGIQIQDRDEPVVVTASALGYLPLDLTVPIAVTQASVVYRTHTVDDCNTSGDCDGALEAGESGQLNVTLRNDGNASLAASTVTIRCTPSFHADLRINGTQRPTRTYLGKEAATPTGPVGSGFRLPLSDQGARVEGKPVAVSLSEHFKLWRDEGTGSYWVTAYSATQSADTTFTGVIKAQGDVTSVSLTGEGNDTYSAFGDSLWFQFHGDLTEDKISFKVEAPNWIDLSSPTKALPALAPSDSATVQFPVTASSELPSQETLRFTLGVSTGQVGSTTSFSDFVSLMKRPNCALAGLLLDPSSTACAGVTLRLTPVIHNQGSGDADSVVCFLQVTGGAMSVQDGSSTTGALDPGEYESGDPFTLCGSSWADTVGLQWSIERHVYHRTEHFQAADVGDHAGGGNPVPANLRADAVDGGITLRWDAYSLAGGYWIGYLGPSGLVVLRTVGPEVSLAEIRSINGAPLAPTDASGLARGYTFCVGFVRNGILGQASWTGEVFPWVRERAGWPKFIPGEPVCAPTVADLSPYFAGAGKAIFGASDRIYGWKSDGATLRSANDPVFYDPGLSPPIPGGTRFTEALAFGNWATNTSTPELAGNLNNSGVYLVGIQSTGGGFFSSQLLWRKDGKYSYQDPILATVLPNGGAGDGIIALGGSSDGAIYVWRANDGSPWGNATTQKFALFAQNSQYNYRSLALGHHGIAAPPPGYDLVASSRLGHLAVFPFTGAGSTVSPRYDLQLESSGGEYRLSSPAVGDVDGDGDNDVVVTSQWTCGDPCSDGDTGRLYLIDAASGAPLINPPPSSTLWRFSEGSTDVPPSGPALVDLDGDGDVEIIVGSLTWTTSGSGTYPTDCQVNVFDYESGAVTHYSAVAKVPITQRNIVVGAGGGSSAGGGVTAIGTPIVGDFDFDGVSEKPDILLPYSMGAVVAFEYDPAATGSAKLTAKPGWPLLLPDIAWEPTVTTLGASGAQYSMVVQCTDGWLHVFDLPRKSTTGLLMDWPSYGGDGGNTRAKLVGGAARPTVPGTGVPSGIGIASIAPVPARGSQRISLTNPSGESVS